MANEERERERKSMGKRISTLFKSSNLNFLLAFGNSINVK